MFRFLEEVINNTLSLREMIEFPVFEDYQDDPEFHQFLDANHRRRRGRLPRTQMSGPENENQSS